MFESRDEGNDGGNTEGGNGVVPTRHRGARRIERVERQRVALELRLQGFSYARIAHQMGWASPSGPYRAVQAALKDVIREPAEQVRLMELGRLDAMLVAYWPLVEQGQVNAGGLVLRVMERRANLLGLDLARSVDMTAEIREWARANGIDPNVAVHWASLVVAQMGC